MTLFSKQLVKRTQATVLYATETGKSEQYAKKLDRLFNCAFNCKVIILFIFKCKNTLDFKDL